MDVKGQLSRERTISGRKCVGVKVLRLDVRGQLSRERNISGRKCVGVKVLCLDGKGQLSRERTISGRKCVGVKVLCLDAPGPEASSVIAHQIRAYILIYFKGRGGSQHLYISYTSKGCVQNVEYMFNDLVEDSKTESYV